jgi:EmrB/QacA subfamily drug resistance transporter
LKEVAVRDHRRRLVLGLLCSVQFVLVLDVTIVAVALPSIRDGLGFSAEGLQWVISAYVLAFAGLLLLGGRAADLWGRRRLFLAGLATFAAASAWCGLAGASWQLVAARAVQGAGAAVVAPAALSLLTTTFAEGAARERALGVWTAAAAGGGAAGFLLGGVLTQALGWRAVFLVNVPVGVLGLLLAPVLPAGRVRQPARRLDLAGAVTLTLGLSTLVYALSRIERAGLRPAAWLPLAAAALLGAAFVARERRTAHPLVPLGALRLPGLAVGSLVAVLLTAVTTPGVLFCVLYLQDVLGYPPTLVGLTVAPFSVAVVAGSLAGARLTDARRLGTRRAMAAGLLGVGLGAAALSTMGTSGGLPPLLVAGFVLAGLGLGIASVASTAAGTAAVPAAQQGLASGLLNTAAQVGTALGLAVLVTVASARAGALTPPGGSPTAAAVVDGYRLAILAGLAVTLAAATALAARRPALPRLRQAVPAWRRGASARGCPDG